MLFHSAEDPRLAEQGFRVVQNSAPLSMTLTAASIGVGMPVILETAPASLPSTDPNAPANYITKPSSVSSSPQNNLFAGVLVRVPGKVNYLAQDAVGLAQVYGPCAALVRREAAGVLSGTPLQITDIGFVSAGTAGPPQGQSGMAVLLETLASSSASEIATARVFLRCM